MASSRLRTWMGKHFEWLVELLGMLLSVAGAALAALLGKLLLASVLGFVALGIYLRFKARRHTQAASGRPLLPGWIPPLAALLALVEAALLARVLGWNLPWQRLEAESHALWQWGLLALAALAAYVLQLKWFRHRALPRA